jgi:energy-coupling factor transporter ATP-binding protein EcfA2
MIAFPVFNSLKISDYGLFPGNDSDPGLNIDFTPGLTLVLGANGLGKSTLILILYRLLAGLADVRADRPRLGTSTRPLRQLSWSERREIGTRVADDAEDAIATLSLEVRKRRVEITRSLKDLALLRFTIDDEDVAPTETLFQQSMLQLSGAIQFDDWLLVLRYVVFYFEERRNLIWDPSAQRQLLRLLCFPAEISQQWSSSERDALILDSRMRNLRNVLNREMTEFDEAEAKTEIAGDVVPQLKLLEKLQADDQEKLEELEDRSLAIAEARESSRRRLLSAQQGRENAYRDVERSRLSAIETKYPTNSETARYIIAQLMSEGRCIVCGHHSRAAAKTYDQRARTEHCVICNTNLSKGANEPSTGLKLRRAERDLERSGEFLAKTEKELVAAHHLSNEAIALYESHFNQTQGLHEEMSARAVKIDALARSLPPDETVLAERRKSIVDLRTKVSEMENDLAKRSRDFQALVESQKLQIAKWSSKIKYTFSKYARGFLLESCRLVYEPNKDRLGESGGEIEYPGFELEMSGTDFTKPVRRAGPDQVSESQREFIDLAFRMTLIEVVTAGGVGTMVLDAPESSLDAIFTTRAADVLAKFAQSDGNSRLVITSNLVAGNLLPELIRKAIPAKSVKHKIVNLLKISAPSAAVKAQRAKYDRLYRTILSSARQK